MSSSDSSGAGGPSSGGGPPQHPHKVAKLGPLSSGGGSSSSNSKPSVFGAGTGSGSAIAGSSSARLPLSSNKSRMTYREPEFTPEMRDLQARGKDPYDASPEPTDGEQDDRLRLGGGPPSESFVELERRRWAASVLDNPEMLMMWAQSQEDSVPSVRLYFTRILCGFHDKEPPRAAENRRAARSTSKHLRSGTERGVW